MKHTSKGSPAKTAAKSGARNYVGSVSESRKLVPGATGKISIDLGLGEQIEVDAAVLSRVINEQLAIDALGASMAAAPGPVSPEVARSVQAAENWWRTTEDLYPSFSSSEVAWILGAKSTNRNLASTQRAAGKMLGYARRNTIRYPKFQFDPKTRAVLPVIPELIAVSRGFGVTDEDLVLWLTTPSTYFAAKDRPVDHLDDPERLLSAARDEFGAQW